MARSVITGMTTQWSRPANSRAKMIASPTLKKFQKDPKKGHNL